MFPFLAILLALAGCICLYLASANQRWLRASWPARPACAAGAALLVLSWLAFTQVMQVLPATFALLTIAMLVLAVLPYLGALRRSRGGA